MAEKQLSYFLEQKSGKQWHLTLSENQKLLYSYKYGENWSVPTEIDRQLHKAFSAAPDQTHRIFVVAFTHTKQLIYYEWNGQEWLQRSIYRIHSRFENISFIMVLPTATTVHIFYYLENSLRKTQESLIHYYMDKDDWTVGKNLNFISDDGVMPRCIAADKTGKIHLVFTKKHREDNHCYYTLLDIGSRNWTVPALLFRTEANLSEFELSIDPSEILHLVWVEEKEAKYRLKYQHKNVDIGEKHPWEEISVLYEGSEKPVHPALIVQDEPLCFFITDTELKASTLLRPEENFPWTEKVEANRLKDLESNWKITMKPDGIPERLSLIGRGYPDAPWSVLEVVSQLPKDRYGRNPKPLAEAQATFEPEIVQLRKQFAQITSQLDEVYSSLYLMQDHLKQRDKSLYQMEATVKRLNFELEQLRPTSVPPTEKKRQKKTVTLDESKTEVDTAEIKDEAKERKKKDLPEEIPDSKDPNEIVLGNISILINPEDEAE